MHPSCPCGSRHTACVGSPDSGRPRCTGPARPAARLLSAGRCWWGLPWGEMTRVLRSPLLDLRGPLHLSRSTPLPHCPLALALWTSVVFQYPVPSLLPLQCPWPSSAAIFGEVSRAYAVPLMPSRGPAVQPRAAAQVLCTGVPWRALVGPGTWPTQTHGRIRLGHQDLKTQVQLENRTLAHGGLQGPAGPSREPLSPPPPVTVPVALDGSTAKSAQTHGPCWSLP